MPCANLCTQCARNPYKETWIGCSPLATNRYQKISQVSHGQRVLQTWTFWFHISTLPQLGQSRWTRPLPDFETWKREKKNIAFWRGSTTGIGKWTASTWEEYPRPKLVLYCKEHEDICDAKFVSYIQGAENIPEMRERLGMEAARVSQADVEEHKFVIVVDGNGPPSSRILSQLQGHSLVLKQESPFYEFFYPSLQPYVHYLPVHVTDVAAAVEWARKHPKQSYQMIVAAREFV
eukprot:jgi/Picre1/29959/NNA_005336.t1